MSGVDGAPEVLAQGPERERPPLLPRLSRPGWARRWWALPLAGIVLLAAGGAVAAIAYVRNAPQLPTLTVTTDAQADADAAAVAAGSGLPAWEPGPDARPARDVLLELSAILTVPSPQARPGKVTVLGLAGPGVQASTPGPIPMIVGQPTRVVLSAVVDCTQVDVPVVASAYGLRVREDEGSRAIEGMLPLGAQSASWDTLLDQACGSWLARRDLTVTAVSSVADPLRTATDLRLTITSTAKQSAYLTKGDFFGTYTVTGQGLDEVRVPGGAQTAVPVHLDLDTCQQTPTGPTAEAGGVATTADAFGLYALVGRRSLPPADPASSDSSIPSDGLGPSGIVLSDQASRDLATALRSACGGLDLVVTRLATHARAIDPATHVLTLHIGVRITSGKALDLSLRSDDFPAGDQSAYRPLWTTSPRLVPDSSGLVEFVLHYGIPAEASACADGGQSIPGLTVIARLPAPGGVKTVRFQEFLGLPPDSACAR